MGVREVQRKVGGREKGRGRTGVVEEGGRREEERKPRGRMGGNERGGRGRHNLLQTCAFHDISHDSVRWMFRQH